MRHSAWDELKDLLNKNDEIPKAIIEREIKKKGIYIRYETLVEYIDLLESCGYIYIKYYHFGYWSNKCELKRNIPKNLTIKKAYKIKKNPWMEWFLE